VERAPVIVLDTHAWLFAVGAPERLSARARGAIDASDDIVVSTMSAWEVAMLVARGRIALDRPVDRWIDDALVALEARLANVDLEIALGGAGLMTRALDPADAMIAATGLAFGAAVVSRDRNLDGVAGLRVIW
jgi:PIN domain nuclease of toxin-antitoxin system